MTPVLLLVGIAVWSAGAGFDLVAGADRRWARPVPFTAGLVGSGVVTIAGVLAVLGRPDTVRLGSTLGVGETTIRLDALAGLFLTLAGGLGMVISLCLVSWSWPERRLRGHGTGAGYLLLLGSVVLIVIAADAFTFLFAWEALTISFYVLVGFRRHDPAQGRAAWATFGIGKLGGAALLFGFLLLAGRAHSYSFAAWAHVPSGSLHDAAFALIVVGFGAKVGLVPLQVWLPIGYPAAPGPTRAAMAGLAANVGFYGLWRFLGILGSPPEWLAVAVLVLGAVTALLGIVFAAVQSELNRVIAFSSVENAGIILVGYGVALAGAATHHSGIVAIGMLAASLQVLAHAVAKSSLFTSSAFIESHFHSDELESLRGIGHRNRFSGAVFAIGSVTLAGLPPTIGFVSEWFILEALLQEFRIHVLALRLGMAFAGALVALTAGVAILCFIRLVGLMVLGRTEHPPSAAGTDGGYLGRAGLALLGAACLALAATAPWVIRFISMGLVPVVPRAVTAGALRSPWVLQPVFADFSILSPSWLFIVMPLGLVAVGLGAMLLSNGRLLRIRRVPAWRSASAGVAGPDRYSAFGYANVLRHVLSNILGLQRSAVMVDDPESPPTDHAHVEVRSSVVDPVETYLYRPMRWLWLWMSRLARRLQSGRLDAYVAYMLVTLIVLLAIVAALD